jgi:hypothetical protein
MQVRKSIEVWKGGKQELTIKIPVKKEIEKIELGSTWVPDVNKADNSYQFR